MKFNLKKELPIILIVLLPLLYLHQVWETLPERIPIHWNAAGEIDGWGEKSDLLLSVFMLPVLSYLLLIFIPKMDPKQKLKNMGKKYDSLKLVVTLVTSAIAILIIYSAENQEMFSPDILFIIIGASIVLFGNYFKTIKHNYFIGIKTPWTLENETVWKETHKMGGKLWFYGGLLIIFLCLLTDSSLHAGIFISILTIISIIPIVYSYIKFKEIQKSNK